MFFKAIFSTSFAAMLAAPQVKGKLTETISWELKDSVLTVSGAGEMTSFTPTSLINKPFADEDMPIREMLSGDDTACEARRAKTVDSFYKTEANNAATVFNSIPFTCCHITASPQPVGLSVNVMANCSSPPAPTMPPSFAPKWPAGRGRDVDV